MKTLLFKFVITTTILVGNLCNKTYTPVVLWHGFGTTHSDPKQMGLIEKLLREYLPSIHIVNIQIGDDMMEDFVNSIFMHPDKQIEIVCDMLKKDSLLQNGYNGITASQASQFMRGLIQRCLTPKPKNLITLAGQHQGVYGLPVCDVNSDPSCEKKRRFLNSWVYSEMIQDNIVPAASWHNPLNETEYITRNSFLADINNERIINKLYIENLQRLEKFVMVKYSNDEVIVPVETEWFGFYKRGQSIEIESLRESELYKSDRLGLKKMDEDGKLDFLENDWTHNQFEWEWFRENIVDVYLV